MSTMRRIYLFFCDSSSRVTLSLICAILLAMGAQALATGDSAATVDIVCSGLCSTYCNPQFIAQECFTVYCCDESQLPCTMDDVVEVTCLGELDYIVITP